MRTFTVNPIGASYTIVYDDVEFACSNCSETVSKMYYSERTGIGQWVCSKNHISMEKIGV